MKRVFIFSALGLGLILILKKIKKMSKFRSNVIDLAVNEWKSWNVPTKVKEGNARTLQKLRDYYKKGVGVNDSDRYYITTAWSAAFISYIMKLAGAGKNFKYSQRHSTYIVNSIKNRKENKGAFKGYKPGEVNIELGDLVCYARQDGINYNTVGDYASHCDIVTKINNNKVEAIGGNISNSVSKSTYNLNDGKIIDKEIFVVIKTNL